MFRFACPAPTPVTNAVRAPSTVPPFATTNAGLQVSAASSDTGHRVEQRFASS